MVRLCLLGAVWPVEGAKIACVLGEKSPFLLQLSPTSL